MAAGLHPASTGVRVDIAYPKLEDGSWNFDRPLYLNPIPWDEWVKLPVRDFDFSISTPKLQVSCGFNDLSHFYRLFRTRYGKPPAMWAKVRRDRTS